ncbi:MAG: glycosyltransferase, partial [Ferruginibacter sp.]
KTYDLVDYFLCPSKFLLQKFIQSGTGKSKLIETNLCYDISFVDNFLKENQALHNAEEKYILYCGRLENIKGVKTLIEAVKNTGITLKIAGSGNEEDNLKKLVDSENIKNVQFLGFRNKNEIFKLINNASFGVCPSEWYENFPYSIAETFLFSKPVIGSNIGGIPELVKDGKTGFLFNTGDASDLREKLLTLWNNEELTVELGKNAREYAYELYNYDTHWNKLNTVIQKLQICN